MTEFTIPTLRPNGQPGDLVLRRDRHREGRMFITSSRGVSLDPGEAIELATALADMAADIRQGHAA